jgi:hypothetical protein
VTSESQHPSRYSIQALLSTAVQPWPNTSDEELEALAKDIRRRGLTDPIDLSVDGIAFDGSQRLRALLKLGRTFIDAGDTRIWPEVNSENILEHAIRRNLLRRHLTVEMKIEAARKMRYEFKWTQSQIGKVFGVSQPRVSQWLSTKVEEDETDPLSTPDEPRPTIRGKDGKGYPAEPAGRGRPKGIVTNHWAPKNGLAFRHIRQALHDLEHEPLGGLDIWQLTTLEGVLDDLVKAATDMAEEVANQREGQPLRSNEDD